MIKRVEKKKKKIDLILTTSRGFNIAPAIAQDTPAIRALVK